MCSQFTFQCDDCASYPSPNFERLGDIIVEVNQARRLLSTAEDFTALVSNLIA